MAAPQADFAHNTAISTAILTSSVSNSQVTFNGADYNGGGNSISGEAFKNTFGVVAIVQNTGINANVQQSVNVTTGDITLATH